MLGAIAASILGLSPWAPNYDRLITETEWQGGPNKSWIPLYKPVTHEYEPFSIGNEIFLFVMALAIGVWAWSNVHHKMDGTLARIVLAPAIACAVYFSLLWLARQHVEGDWTAAPPRLMKYEVDTPEFLAKEAAWKAEMQQLEYKRLGLSPTGERILHKVCIYF